MATSYTNRTEPSATSWDTRSQRLLMETGDALLQEDGTYILLEQEISTTYTARTEP